MVLPKISAGGESTKAVAATPALPSSPTGVVACTSRTVLPPWTLIVTTQPPTPEQSVDVSKAWSKARSRSATSEERVISNVAVS